VRNVARIFLLGFVFVVPWQYSVDFPAPVGNLARVLGLVTLIVAIPAVLGTGRMRPVTSIHWYTLALLGWFALTYFWSIDPHETLEHLRGNVQEVMVLWLAWELADEPEHLRDLLRAFLAGSIVLAVMTIAMVAAPDAVGQARFAPPGQDPNDVARFLDLGFPLAGLLARYDPNRLMRVLALVYLPLGLLGVLLTASRGGVLAASVGLTAAAAVLLRGNAKRMRLTLLATPVALGVIAALLPADTIARILTIPEQLAGGGDLNQRLGIWAAGVQALARAPFFGSGAGTYVAAAGLAPVDTAHNTPLAIAVEAGVVGLAIACAILTACVRCAWSTAGFLRHALLGSLAVWAVTSMVATVHENRTTWVLIALIAVAGRMAADSRNALDAAFQSWRVREAEPALRTLP
jgi:hypothetical protein